MLNLKQGITMNHCSVLLWYNKQRVNKTTGLASLYLQLIVGSERGEVKLSLKWPVEFIDWKKRTLVPRSAGDSDYNIYLAHIERERAKHWGTVQYFINNDRRFTLADVFKAANYHKSGLTLLEFMDQHMKLRQKTPRLKDKIKGSTARIHLTTWRNLKAYLCGNDVSLTSVDDQWLEDFANHLRKTISENTVWVNIQNIKSYLSYAERNRIEVNQNYKLFTVTPQYDEAVFLEDYELTLLFEKYYNDEIHPELRSTLRAFLFSCVTGLRVSDMMRWRKDWVKDNKIEFIPTKTRIDRINPKPVIIPVMRKAQHFINHLSGDSMQIMSDVVYNRKLKEVAVACGITKNLTSHVARHTFGTTMAMAGVAEPVIAKIMGHSKVETTRQYMHIAKKVKEKAMMMLDGYFDQFMPEEKIPG